MTTIINTQTKTIRHTLTDDEFTLLGQIIDIDGDDTVIVSRADLRNGSGRVVGELLIITDEAWDYVQQALTSI